jgi:chaperone BCS1
MTEYFKLINDYVISVVGGNEMAAAFIIGAIVSALMYLARLVPTALYRQIEKHLTVSLTVRSSDETYYHLLSFLNDRYAINNKARSLMYYNGIYGYDKTTLGMGSTSMLVFIKRRLVLISITTEKLDNKFVNILTMKTIGRSKQLFIDLDREVVEYMERDEDIRTFECSSSGELKQTGLLNKRYLDTIYHDDNVKDRLVSAIQKFIDSEDEYKRLGIPYNLGILLYGPPGTGKTSLVRAIATEFDKSVITVNSSSSLSSACLSPRASGNIIFAEEVDGYTAKRESDPKDKEGFEQYKEYSLSTVLTSIDGINSAYGRILIMTTNHIEKLDDALLRNGRMDEKIYVGPLTIKPFCDMVEKFTGVRKDHNTYALKEGTKASDVQAFLRQNKNADKAFEMFTVNAGDDIDENSESSDAEGCVLHVRGAYPLLVGDNGNIATYYERSSGMVVEWAEDVDISKHKSAKALLDNEVLSYSYVETDDIDNTLKTACGLMGYSGTDIRVSTFVEAQTKHRKRNRNE